MATQSEVSKHLKNRGILSYFNKTSTTRPYLPVEKTEEDRFVNKSVLKDIDKSKNKNKKRGAYKILSDTEKAKIARYATEQGNTKAGRKYDISESTVRNLKKIYLKKLKEVGNPNDITSLEHGARGRPLLLGQFDEKVQSCIKNLRLSGGIVNNTIVISAAKGIVSYHDNSLLSENGGHLEIGKSWAKSLLIRMGYVKRKSTKEARKLPRDFEELKVAFFDRIKEAIQTHNVPQELIINIDQTGCKLVPTSEWTMEAEGSKQVAVKGVDDKREITALLGVTMSGTFISPQIIYAGKTNRCHPDIVFPVSWNITHSDNHWSTSLTMFEYADKVLVPYIHGVRRVHNLGQQKAILILDVFAAHRVDTFLDKLKAANIIPIYVPGNCTGELQTLDVAINDVFKKKLKQKFSEYYAEKVQQGLRQGLSVEDIHIDLSTAKVKCLQAKWLISVISAMKRETNVLKAGFIRSGIFPYVQDICQLLPNRDENRPGLFDVFNVK